MKQLSNCALFLLLALPLAQIHGQDAPPVRDRVALTRMRIRAGDSSRASWPAGRKRMAAVRDVRTTPPLAFPPRVETTPGDGQIRLLVMPATPPGAYRVDVDGTAADGTPMTATTQVDVDAVTIPKAAVARNPVILLNGFQAICLHDESTVARAADTFGNMATYLQNDGVPVAFFNNCSYGDLSIPSLAEQLKTYLALIRYSDGSSVDLPFDLVCHSMGGLIGRAYLAGIRWDGSFDPPENPRIRKLVTVGTPHFGSFVAPSIGTQTSDMVPGSAFLWNLARWNQNQDDLRGVDALAIAGDAGDHYGQGADDGVVSVLSASLGFTASSSRSRILHYCHVTPSLTTRLGMDCSGKQGIADVDSPSHQTWQIVRSFLSDDPGVSPAWDSVGSPANNARWASYGGLYLALAQSDGSYVNDLTDVFFGRTKTEEGGAFGAVYYGELPTGSDTLRYRSSWLGDVDCGTVTAVPGYYRPVLCKYGPLIFSVTPRSRGSRGLLVSSGARVSINGASFGAQCSSCKVIAEPGPTELPVSSWTDTAISALLPGTYNGLVTLKVVTDSGSDRINLMASPAAAPVSVVGRMLARSGDQNSCAVPAPATSFSTEDQAALLWFSVAGASLGDTATVTWYSPSGPVYRSASWKPLASAGSFCFWDSMAIAGAQAAYSPGYWSVRVAWNGTDLFTQNFTLLAAGQSLQPKITSLNPSSAIAGLGGTSVAILGSEFLPNSTVTFDGQVRAVSGVPDARQLTIALTPADLASPGDHFVVVYNPSGSGGSSNRFPFHVLDGSSGDPAVTSMATSQRVYTAGNWFAAAYSSFAGAASGKYDLMVVFTPQATGNKYYYYDDPSDSSEWLHSTPRALRTGVPETGRFTTPSFQVTDDVPSGDYHIVVYFSVPGANTPVGAAAESDFTVATNTSAGGCFIATAAFGSAMSRQVRTLRQFRDRVLLPGRFGRRFVDWYYRWSPSAAASLQDRPLLRKLSRAMLWPGVLFARIAIGTNVALAALALASFAALIGWILARAGTRLRLFFLVLTGIAIAAAAPRPIGDSDRPGPAASNVFRP